MMKGELEMIKLSKKSMSNIFPSDRAMLKAFLLLYKVTISGIVLWIFAKVILKTPLVVIGIVLIFSIFLVTAWYCERLVIQEDLEEAHERERKREEFKIHLKEIADRREREAKLLVDKAREYREAEL